MKIVTKEKSLAKKENKPIKLVLGSNLNIEKKK